MLERVFVILVGPKGSGKTHIGRILEARLGVHFFHIEPLWLAYHRDCEAAGRQPVIAEGIVRIHRVLAGALDQHAKVCVETTGASSEILAALQSLRPRSEIIIARVTAPLELCLHRISTREQTDQIPLEMETVRKVYALSESPRFEAAITLDNTQLTEEEIVEAFNRALTARPVHPRQLVQAWVDAFNRADPDTLAAFYAEDAVNHQVPESPVHGRRAIREMFAADFASATMVCELENIFVDGEWGILEWRDPLGLRGCGFFHIVGGHIVFQRGYWDKLSLSCFSAAIGTSSPFCVRTGFLCQANPESGAYALQPAIRHGPGTVALCATSSGRSVAALVRVPVPCMPHAVRSRAMRPTRASASSRTWLQA